MFNLYCFTGLPLSGKSYAAKLIAAKCGGHYISTGDIARELSTSEELKKQTREKDLFPLEDLLRERLAGRINVCSNPTLIVDGFPRFDDQVRFLKESDLWMHFPKIVYVEAGDDVTLVNRAKMRSRDTQDSDPEQFAKRLNMAKKNMSGVFTTANELLIPQFTIMSGSDESMVKQFKKVTNA